MPISIFKKAETSQTQISIAEAFNLWNTLRARYASVELNQMYQSFVHDRDFQLVLSNELRVFKRHIQILEKLANEYQVKLSGRPPETVQFAAEVDHITDSLIFRSLTSDLISELYSLNRAVTSTLHNDVLRRHFRTFLTDHLGLYADLYKHGKLKAWAQVAPAFKTNQPVQKEMLSVNEADHLWEHISLRYDQIHLTTFYFGVRPRPGFSHYAGGRAKHT